MDELIRPAHEDPLPAARLAPLDPLDPAVTAVAEPTIFTLLADRARHAPGEHLGAAALLGALDAALFGSAHPALWWVAAGSVSLAAYGCWGLADRALARADVPRRRIALRVLRDGATAVGCVAALGVVFGFLAAALGGYHH